MISKTSIINFLAMLLISSDAFAGSNTGGFFNNLAWSLIAVFLIYEVVKGNKRRIVGVTVYSLVVIAIGLISPLYSGIAVLLTPIVALLIGGYFSSKKRVSLDLEVGIQKQGFEEVPEKKFPENEKVEEDKYLRESREALERIKANPSIVLSRANKEITESQQIPPHTKEIEYLLGGVPHKWDGSKFIEVKKQRD